MYLNVSHSCALALFKDKTKGFIIVTFQDILFLFKHEAFLSAFYPVAWFNCAQAQSRAVQKLD